MKKISYSLLILVLFFFIFYHNNLLAGEASRPFWTEKSAFVEGETLFVVGVSSHIKTVEEGRQKAFDHGKIELMNYAQVTDVESQGLVIETQMTYEETHKDGTVSVFRLLRVPTDKLLAIQGKIKLQREEEVKKINQMHTDLLALQKTLIEKQQGLETQTVATEQMLKKITTTEESLSLRTKQIENQQKEIEALLSKLSGNMEKQQNLETQAVATEQMLKKITTTEESLSLRIKQIENQQKEIEAMLSRLSGNSEGKEPTFQKKLKDVEAQLDTREQEIANVRQKILTRIKEQTNQACKYITRGMTPADVEAILGEPTGKGDYNTLWSYGTAKIYFDNTFIVISVDCK